MARIKKYSPLQNLSSFQTFINDENPNSDYFRITEFKDTFTGGKNGFLIEGSEYLKESTEIKIEILDVNGDPVYYEPGNGIPEYYEGTSKLIAVYIYNDTPIGLGKITILGELKEYDDNGIKRQIPDDWKGAYNVKWERTFQINKLLANEDRVRFYRRPDVTIEELNKPIFSNNSRIITQTGSLDGVPLVPTAGTKLSNFRLPTSYRLNTNTSNNWTGSVVGQRVTFDDITYNPTILEVVNETEVIVSPPYTVNDIVTPFTDEDYSVSFNYLEGVVDLATALTGSFAKITINDMNTFVGDAARVKVFRRSQSQLTDYEFVQEIQLESNELLRDIETTATNQLNYGSFTQDIFNEYWVTSSNDLVPEINQSFLYNSVKLDSTGTNTLFTSRSFDVRENVEYTLTFNVRKSGSVSADDYIKAFLGSTPGPIVEDLTGAIACSTAATYTGGESYPTTQSVNLGENTGTTELQFNAINVPDRFIVEWDGNYVIDSGYVGGTAYDFGGASRSTFTTALTGKTDPITGNTYPDLTTYPDDGYPRVTTASAPLPAGSGSLSFNKTTSSPQLAEVSVYAPLGGTAWDLTLNCPQDPPISGVERISNPTVTQTVTTVNSSNSVLQKTPIEVNFLADNIDDVRLYFETVGSGWYISDVSLKASQETSFSPDTITFIQNVPKTLQVETFDYRFEFYDINNNYIPVLVEETKRFDGGNLNLFEKSIEITPSNLYFTFDSASLPANPLPPTSIIFDIQTSLITGSISFTSGAYDEFGNFLSASEYAGGQYPGLLKDLDTRTPTLNVADFTGSRSDIAVQYIRFTGFAEGVSDEVVITRVQDGKGGVNFEIVPFRGTSIKNKSDKDLEIQAYRIDGINRIELKDNLPQTGFSDAKLRVLSSSIDPITSNVSSSYFLLSEAQSNGFIRGLQAGTTGSGEIDYNATFNRDSIDNELTVYLMDGPTSESILTSIILNDLQDGLASGFISFDAEQFGIKPRDERVFTPEIGRVTGSFYLRGTNSSPISGTLDIYPSMSVDPDTKEPFYYMFYVTDSFDRRIDIVVTDKDNNIVDSGRPGVEVPYFVPSERKQLTTTFTYTEDITSASISVDKTFFSVPDGLPGADSIIVDIDPRPVVLNADQRGRVFNYSNADTTITVTQGRLPLIFNDTKKPGTFTTASITPLGIEYTTFDEVLGDATMSLSGFQRMSDLTASVTYELEIHPYFTGSFYTQSFVQQFKKTLEGADAINIELDPTNVQLNAEENGGVADFSAANTTLRVKQGDTYLEFSTSSLVLPGTFSASLSPNLISISTFSSSNDNSTERNLDDTLHFRDFNNFLKDSGSVDYQITVYPFSVTNGILSGSQVINRKQLFTKNKEGVKARSIELTTTTEVANYDKDGIITSPVDPVSGEPTSIFLTATAFNITSSQAYYQFFQEGFAVTFPGTNNQFEVGSGDLPSPGTTTTYRVDLRDGDTNGPVFASKEVTISGVQSGANNYQVFLTNPSPTITVKVDGELDLSTTGTQIKAFKGTQELTHVQNYSAQQLDNVGDPIGTLGEFSSSLYQLDTYITQPSYPQGNPASIGALSDWTSPQNNPTATAIYKVDIENGRATYFLSQSLAATFEGDVGPGLVFRGPWTGSIEYIYNKDSKRRDAVLYSESGNEPYDTYYATKDSGSSFTTFADSTPGAGDASAPTRDDGLGGREVNDDFWVSLGQEEFFVAAKLAIFEESFVKNTLNVGTPPTSYAVNPQITIAGGTDEPYIAVGQTGTIGYDQQGIWLGMSNSAGDAGTSILPKMSMKSNTVAGRYKSLEWNGETLTIRGAIRQTDAGQVEPSLRGNWADATEYYINDSVIYNGQSWSSDSNHTSNTAGGVTTGPPGTGPWTAASGTGKTVSLSATTFVIEYDQDGNHVSPNTIDLIASSSNFIDPYFKFTGGGSNFTDETSFTNGADGDNDSVSGIDLSSTTISDMPLQFRVGVADGGLSGQDQVELVSDVINVFGIQPGADSTPMYFITPIAGGTQIKNSSGNIELQVQKSDSTGLTNLSSGDIKIYSGATVITSVSGVTGTDYNPTISDTAINGTLTLTLKDSSTTYDTITLVDVTDGLGGGSFISPNLKSTRNPADNSFNPTILQATASFYDTSGTEYQGRVTITPSFSGGVDRMAVSTKAGDSEVVITASDGDGGSVTLGGASVPTKDIVLTAEFTDPATGQTTTINETFYIISDGLDGLDGITVINTNQAHTLPADSGGSVSSFTDSGTTIILYEGTTKLNYDGTGTTAGTYKVSIPAVSGVGIGAASADGNNDLNIADHTSMTPATAVITYNITGTRNNGESFTAEATQTLTKAVAGVAGSNGTSGTGGTSGADGTNGAAGQAAGIVYAGEWGLTLPDGSTPNLSNKLPYLSEDDLVYVTKHNGNYYTCETTHRYCGSSTGGNVVGDVVLYSGNYFIANKSTADDPQGEPADWDDLGTDISPDASWPINGYTLWASFGAEFTSVATDILFANDVYADRTINIGTKGGTTPVIALNADAGNSNQNPFISIGQDTQGFTNDGIYFGYEAGSPVLSMVTGSSYFIYESGSIELSDATLTGTGSVIVGSEILVGETAPGSGEYNFRVDTDGNLFAQSGSFRGSVTATDGAIGAWVVDENAITSQNAQVELNATDEFIELRNSSLVPKVMLNTDSSLFNPGSAASATFNSPVGGYYNGNSAETFSAYGTANNGFITVTNIATRSSTFTVSTTGVYSIVFTPTANKSSVTATGVNSFLYAQTNLRVRTGSASGTLLSTIGSWSATAWGYDSTGGFTSVIGTTKILLSDGSIKLAKDITKDDKILVWDEKDKKYSEGDISEVRSRTVDSIFRVTAGGKQIEVSDTHGFWLDGGDQILVKDIIAGETKIYVKDGDTAILVVVDSVEEVFGEEEVYTFTVPQFVNYISNGIISHNAAGSNYPETDTQYYPSTTKSKTLSLTAGTTYYLTFETNYYGSVYSTTSLDFYTIRGVEFSIDVESDSLVGQSTNAGTEVNDAGLQVASGDERVFRADTTTSAGSPWITQLGGTQVDYFVPRYSIAPDAGTYPKSYGQSNTNINYQDPAYPLTRAMCKVVVGGAGATPTAYGPKINVDTVSRTGTGVYQINLQTALTDWDGVAMVSAFGRWQSSSPYYNSLSAGDNEYTHNIGVNASDADGTTPSVTINFKDNNADGDRDPYTFYFVMFG